MGAGRDLVQQSWTNITLGVQLCGILSDLSWGGWQLLEFPHVIKHLPDLLDSDAVGGLGLLAALHSAQRVKGVPTAWLLRLEEWILKRFESWVMPLEKVRYRLDRVAPTEHEVNRSKNFITSSASLASSQRFYPLCAVLLTMYSIRLIPRQTIKLVPRTHAGCWEVA